VGLFTDQEPPVPRDWSARRGLRLVTQIHGHLSPAHLESEVPLPDLDPRNVWEATGED
jgi:hypothetical protein